MADEQITNRWREARTSKPRGRRTAVHTARAWDAAYSHHPQIVSYQGRLLATWSLGNLHEDTPGQRMVLLTSTDLGETWSEPTVLVAPVAGKHAPTVVTSMGLRVVEDQLVGYFASYEYTLEGLKKFAEFGANARGIKGLGFVKDTYTGVITSNDGQTWSAPQRILPRVLPNFSPVRTSSGRLILPGHRLHPYTDDPKGLTGWRIATYPGVPENYYDGAGAHIETKTDWARLGICEGSVYELPDGRLRMMSRTHKGFLAASESTDNGQTWSAPRPTAFTDCGARFQFGKLPDGRFYALSCPNPNVPESCLRRTPLVLAVSEDGDVFDRHFILGDEPDRPPRYPGAYKHGRYGYPYAHVAGRSLFIVNSVAKEDIELNVFDLDVLK